MSEFTYLQKLVIFRGVPVKKKTPCIFAVKYLVFRWSFSRRMMGLICFFINKQFRILVQIAMKGPDLLQNRSRFYLKVLFSPYYNIFEHKVPMPNLYWWHCWWGSLFGPYFDLGPSFLAPRSLRVKVTERHNPIDALKLMSARVLNVVFLLKRSP